MWNLEQVHLCLLRLRHFYFFYFLTQFFMAGSLGTFNRITLIGYETADVKRTSTAKGSVVSFSLTTHHGWKTKTGEWKRETDFHRIVLFGIFADRIHPYLAKGKKLFIEGELRNRSYVSKDGEKKYSYEIVCDNVLFLDRKDGVKAKNGDQDHVDNEEAEEVFEQEEGRVPAGLEE